MKNHNDASLSDDNDNVPWDFCHWHLHLLLATCSEEVHITDGCTFYVGRAIVLSFPQPDGWPNSSLSNSVLIQPCHKSRIMLNIVPIPLILTTIWRALCLRILTPPRTQGLRKIATKSILSLWTKIHHMNRLTAGGQGHICLIDHHIANAKNTEVLN